MEALSTESVMRISRTIGLLASICFAAPLCASPFHGSWAFELPDGTPAWLQIKNTETGVKGSLLWSVGSAGHIPNLQLTDGVLSFERKIRWRPYTNQEDYRRKDATTFRGKVLKNGALELKFWKSADESKTAYTLRGKKMPPMPPAPDLSKVKFGNPIRLFNGKDLAGWKLFNPNKINGWRAENGELVNETPKTDFGAYGDFGNLVTERKFDDFRLSIEYNVGKDRNSGIYLRGMYEAQVVDAKSRMQGMSGPGAIYGRIAPSENAGKPAGQWNKYVITLVDRHVTVILNGRKVIDNQPIEGCTGGGISADDTQPGPLFLQGDHTNVRYRNIVLEPVVK